MNIRTKRALALCGFLPTAEDEILDSLPPELLTELTSRQLAQVMRALNKHWHKACAYKEREIVGEGCVWSVRDGKMLDVVYLGK